PTWMPRKTEVALKRFSIFSEGAHRVKRESFTLSLSAKLLVDTSLPSACTCPDCSTLPPGCSCSSEWMDAQHQLPHVFSLNEIPESYTHPTIDPGHEGNYS